MRTSGKTHEHFDPARLSKGVHRSRSRAVARHLRQRLRAYGARHAYAIRGSVIGTRREVPSAPAHTAPTSTAGGTKTPWFPWVRNFSQGATPTRLMRWGGRKI